jgi:3'-5' exoribonuclease 1
MSYIIVDLEATCWEKGTRPGRQEIIEIGAMRFNERLLREPDEFSAFVRPLLHPILSRYCVQLTGIGQTDVDKAELFPEVFTDFLNWIGNGPFALASWGAYDLNQFRNDCRRHSLKFPKSFERHINLKKEFARLKGIKPMTMKAALRYLNVSLDGRHHRGIDDARNIAKIAQTILPELIVEQSPVADQP